MKIITLTPNTREPDLRIVAKLEELLSEAKAGDIKGFAFAAWHADGAVQTNGVGEIGAPLVGGLAYIQHSCLACLSEDDE